MIKDNIKNHKNYLNISEYLNAGFEYLVNTDFSNLPCGRYPIIEDKVYANVDEYAPKKLEEGKFEAHKKYADIQYIVKGSEKIGYEEISKLDEITDYDKEKDIVFLKEKTNREEFVKLEEKDFAVFFPQDAHMPQISDGSSNYVKKVVIKVLFS